MLKFTLLFLLLIAPAILSAQQVALVIGNSDYQVVADLDNPGNDSAAVSKALRNQGFEVVTANNLTRSQLYDALRDFRELADRSDIALVYYAGHGIEVNGLNYLIPVDARLRDERDARVEMVEVGDVLAQISGTRALKMVVLDACRNNPFLARMKREGKGRNIGRGLSLIEPVEADTLVAYAAAAGEITPDGLAGSNSPFTAAFVKALQGPPRDVRLMLGAVRDEMRRTVPGAAPAVYSSLGGGEYVINPQSAVAIPKVVPKPAPPVQTASIGDDFAAAFKTSSIAGWADFLDRYQDRKTHTLYTLAAERKRALEVVPAPPVQAISIEADFSAAFKTSSVAGWVDFLDKYQDRKSHRAYTLAAEKKRALEAIQITPKPATNLLKVFQDYEAAQKVGTRESWNAFLNHYKNLPESFYIRKAKQQRNAILTTSEDTTEFAVTVPAQPNRDIDTDFSKARDGETVEAWDAFLTAYATTPNAPNVLKARKQRDALIVALALKDRDLAVERALSLTLDEKKHIVYVLNARFGKNSNLVPIRYWSNKSDSWLVRYDRDGLRRYSKSAGYPETEYLTRPLADILLKENLPLVLNDKWGDGPRKTHNDWTSMVVNNGEDCRILTNATRVSGWSPYFAPQMTFRAKRSLTKSTLTLDMVRPNPFLSSKIQPIYALVDGRRYKLLSSIGYVKPRNTGKNLFSNDIMKAIRRGRSIEIVSKDRSGENNLSVVFSASGFTAAFNQMMKDCNRPGLSAWIR